MASIRVTLSATIPGRVADGLPGISLQEHHDSDEHLYYAFQTDGDSNRLQTSERDTTPVTGPIPRETRGSPVRARARNRPTPRAATPGQGNDEKPERGVN